MVFGLELAAIGLIGFVLWAARRPTDKRGLQTASRVMALIVSAATVLVPLAVSATFLFPDRTAALNLRLYHLSAEGALTSRVPLDDRLAAFACAIVPIGIVVWGLFSLRRLLLLYAKGEVFTKRALVALSAVTAAPFWYGVAGFLAQAPISLALSWAKPVGHRVVTLSIGLDDLVPLFLAAVATVIVQVMAEASRVAEENARFV